VYKQHYDNNGRPLAQFHAAIVVENGAIDFRTTEPATMGFDIKQQTYDGGIFEGGKMYLRNLMIRIPVDQKRSKLKAPPQTADWVTIPETSGGFSAGASADPTEESTATGIMCGAIDVAMMESMPTPAPTNLLGGLLKLNTQDLLCPDQAGKVRPCENGVEDLKAGKCDSMLKSLQVGCTGSGLITMYPMGEPDVDADGDGKGDAYSMVSKIAVQRARVSAHGFIDGEPPMVPLTE
jgi:hypothetical protein